MPPKLNMASRRSPDLTGSTLADIGHGHYVDTASGVVLSRLGWLNSHGYEVVARPGGSEYVHRLVMEALTGVPIPAGLTINHLDGNKQNNHPSNLELATQSQQRVHMYATGLRARVKHPASGSKSRLTDDEVRRIIDAPRGTITALAKELGISRGYAYDIRNRRKCTWAA